MDNDDVREVFEQLRDTIKTADEETRQSLPCIAGRLRRSGAGKFDYREAEALSELKRELRDWDITRQKWNPLKNRGK